MNAGGQLAGQAATQNSTFLKGGVLQRGIKQQEPEELIEVETGDETPEFTPHELSVHAGSIVSMTLRNTSSAHLRHIWVLGRPGTGQALQEAARAAGPAWNWIPDSPDVLAFVPLTEAGESQVVLFRAPAIPGDYPFFSTLPGYGEKMNGVLRVLQ